MNIYIFSSLTRNLPLLVERNQRWRQHRTIESRDTEGQRGEPPLHPGLPPVVLTCLATGSGWPGRESEADDLCNSPHFLFKKSRSSHKFTTNFIFIPTESSEFCGDGEPASVNTLKLQSRTYTHLTLPKCRLLCEVDYESMPSFPIFRCSLYLVILHSFGSCDVSCPGISWSATGSSAFYLSFY